MTVRAPRATARPRVAAIVPAYNEQATIAEVLAGLREAEAVDEILVVSDGSTDDTVAIARRLGVRTLHLRHNAGKAHALAVGVAHTTAPVLFFVDGDILRLSADLVGELVEPVASGRADMVIGLRHRGHLLDFVHRRFGPHLSGIRCLRRELFDAVPDPYLRGYAVETALNWSCRRLGGRLETRILWGLAHLVKEKKRGLAAGIRDRLVMFARVFLAWLSLTLTRPEVRPRNRPRPAETDLEFSMGDSEPTPGSDGGVPSLP